MGRLLSWWGGMVTTILHHDHLLLSPTTLSGNHWPRFPTSRGSGHPDPSAHTTPQEPQDWPSSEPAKQRVFLHRTAALRGQTLLSWPAPCLTTVFLKKGPSSVWFPQEVGLGGSLVAAW